MIHFKSEMLNPTPLIPSEVEGSRASFGDWTACLDFARHERMVGDASPLPQKKSAPPSIGEALSGDAKPPVRREGGNYPCELLFLFQRIGVGGGGAEADLVAFDAGDQPAADVVVVVLVPRSGIRMVNLIRQEPSGASST